jgi:cytochrome c oxidase assembly factor CtaG
VGDLLIPAAALAAALLFARGWSRLRRRGGRGDAGFDRLALYAAGVLVALFATLVLHGHVDDRASTHMLQHVLLGDLAPALVLVALRGRLLHAVLPKPFRRLFAHRAVRAVVRPLPSLALWAGLLWVWHVPPVYDAALAHEPLHALEHASFVVGGFLLWNQLVDPARRRALSLWGSLGYALVAMLAAQMLVLVLVLSYRPLYVYGDAADQGLAGLIMALEQFLTLGTFAYVRLRGHFREPLVLSEGHPLRV